MKTALCCASLLAASVAAAQSAIPPVEIERLTLNPSRGGLLVSGGELLAAGTFRASLTGHYEQEPLAFINENGDRGAAVAGRSTVHAAGAYAFTDRLELGLQIPVVVAQGSSQQFEKLGYLPVETSALGTPWIQGRLGLLSEVRSNPLDLSLGVAVGLPVGSRAALTRNEKTAVTLRAGAGVTVGGKVRLAAEGGATLRSKQALTVGSVDTPDEVGSLVDLSLGASTVGPRTRVELNLIGAAPLSRSTASLELLGGVRYALSEFEVYGLAGPALGRSPGTPVFRLLVGAAIIGPPPPEPKCVVGKPYELTECPDLDFDGDGVRNGDDRCPTVRGSASAAGCPDSDLDGIVDSQDKCPAQPGVSAFQGCPDTDKDGLPDAEDKCPQEPGERKRDGCPARDSDGDGILDEQDACPKVPGVPAQQGCPVPDKDGDGVLDAEDNCKADPGPKENQGCPEAKKQLVTITKDKLVIMDRVYFDSGRATIQPRSYPLLEQVAFILKDHPEVARVLVEGHTDDRGKPDKNRVLSQDRAEAVMNYLIGQGVAASRLAAKGYGPDRPIDSNKTAAGREQNRRVEFTIVSGGE